MQLITINPFDSTSFVSLVPDAIPRNIQGLGSGVFRNNMEISWEVTQL